MKLFVSSYTSCEMVNVAEHGIVIKVDYNLTPLPLPIPTPTTPLSTFLSLPTSLPTPTPLLTPLPLHLYLYTSTYTFIFIPPFLVFSLFTWKQPEATWQLFIALCAAFLATCLLPGDMLFFLGGESTISSLFFRGHSTIF